MGGVLLAPSSAPCLLPRSFTILCPGEAGVGHPHECQQRPEARARTGGRMGPQAGGGGLSTSASWGRTPRGSRHRCLWGQEVLGGEIRVCASHQGALSVRTSRFWPGAGQDQNLAQSRPCALRGKLRQGAGGSHGGSQLLQVASKPSAQLQDTSSGHWKRLGFGRWSRAPPGLRHPAPLARAVPALPRPGAPSRSCSQGPVPVPLAPIGADVLYLSEIKNSGGGMERQEAQESSLVVRDRGTELTCSGGFGANTARIVIR